MNGAPALLLQARTFLLLGATGFLVDGSLLVWLSQQLDMDLVRSRIISFSAAVSVTWLLNRRLTFPDHASRRKFSEWIRYFAVNGVGALLNLGVFLLLIEGYPALQAYPLVPLAVAALLALVFNFFASRSIAFRVPAPLKPR